MKNGILNELISTMRERIPQDMNLANTLADILCMGKEAPPCDTMKIHKEHSKLQERCLY